MTQENLDSDSAIGALRGLIDGDVHFPGEPGYDVARGAYNLMADQRPAAVAVPRTAAEVSALMHFAGSAGLRVAPQRTGHGSIPLASLERSILVKTNALDRVEIDADGLRAQVGGGVRWEAVVPAASELGLAALHGSTPDVSIAGYSLGGGMNWYGRKYGLAANSVTAIEVVTPAGEICDATPGHEPELFWALRGGGGNFGVVTALEFKLYPIGSVYAGALFFPLERAGEVLHTWHEWTATAPEDVTSVGRILRFPPVEEVPDPLRGNAYALVEAIFLCGEEEATRLLEPLRELGAEIDTFATTPPVGIAELHMDPVDPLPYDSAHAMLSDLPPEAIDAFVEAAGAESGMELISVELRHCGGALGRRPEGAGALGSVPGSYSFLAIGVTDPADPARTEAELGRTAEAFSPWDVGVCFNFVEHAADAATFYPPEVAARLVAARDTYDPGRVMQANLEIGAR